MGGSDIFAHGLRIGDLKDTLRQIALELDGSRLVDRNDEALRKDGYLQTAEVRFALTNLGRFTKKERDGLFAMARALGLDPDIHARTVERVEQRLLPSPPRDRDAYLECATTLGRYLFILKRTQQGGTLLRYDVAYESYEEIRIPHGERLLQSAALTTLGERIALVGGVQRPGGRPWSFLFDPKTREWESLPDMSRPRHGAAAAALQGRLCVIGGAALQDGQLDWSETIGSAEAYDPKTRTWSDLPDIPVPRAEATAVAFAGELYVIGGNLAYRAGTGGRDALALSQRIDVYDPVRDAWQQPLRLPEARRKPSAWVQGDKLYVGAGWGRTKAVLTVVEVWDPARNTWSEGHPLPIDEADAACVSATDQEVFCLHHDPGAEDWTITQLVPLPPEPLPEPATPEAATARARGSTAHATAEPARPAEPNGEPVGAEASSHGAPTEAARRAARRAARKAAREAARKAAREAALEAEREAARRAERRTARRAARKAERTAALEAEREAALEAEREAALEAEREAAREAALEAAREAARKAAREAAPAAAREAARRAPRRPAPKATPEPEPPQPDRAAVCDDQTGRPVALDPLLAKRHPTRPLGRLLNNLAKVSTVPVPNPHGPDPASLEIPYLPFALKNRAVEDAAHNFFLRAATDENTLLHVVTAPGQGSLLCGLAAETTSAAPPSRDDLYLYHPETKAQIRFATDDRGRFAIRLPKNLTGRVLVYAHPETGPSAAAVIELP